MKPARPTPVISSLLLGAALTLALGACAPKDNADDRAADTPAATPAPDAAPAASAADTAAHDGMAGMDGQNNASNEMDRIMKESMAMPMTMSGDVDKDFASMMTMHHQTAIKMIDVYEKGAQSADLKALAQKMKSDQQEEIKQLEPFANAAGAMSGMAGMTSEGSTALEKTMKDSMAMPMTMSGNADKDFASMMTMHHQTAIKMIDIEQKSGKAADLKALGAKMKAAQQEEIKKMEPFTK